jgi:hypothetical protein
MLQCTRWRSAWTLRRSQSRAKGHDLEIPQPDRCQTGPCERHLLATGATDGEVLIWDLARPDAPTSKSPGAKVGHAAYVRWR